jgi:hypothetical protein
MKDSKFKTPDGKYTSSVDVYTRKWRAVIESFERATGTRVTGFDPSVSGVDNKGENKGKFNGPFQVPLWLVYRVIEVAKKAREA